MVISVIAENRKGILSRLAVMLKRQGFTIEAQRHMEIDPADAIVYTFAVRGRGPFKREFLHYLEALPHIKKVNIREALEEEKSTESVYKTLIDNVPGHIDPVSLRRLAKQPDLVTRILDETLSTPAKKPVVLKQRGSVRMPVGRSKIL